MNTIFLVAITSIGQLLSLPFAVVLAALGIPLALTAVLCALRNAPEGYENAEGFHWARRGFRGRHSLGSRVVRPTTQSKHARISLFPSYEI